MLPTLLHQTVFLVGAISVWCCLSTASGVAIWRYLDRP